MNVQELFAHDLNHLNDHIATLEAELNGKLPQDVSRGDKLTLRQYRLQAELLTRLVEQSSDIESGIATCGALLIAVEERHSKLALSGHAHDIAHADQWWDTEAQRDYLSECMAKLENARAK